jgi:hypothetical protein
MKKLLSLLLIFLFTFVSVQFSQTASTVEKTGGFARLQAMGQNPYVIDPFFMTLNPAWGADYDNFIFGDLGSTQTAFGNDGAGQYIGANFKVAPNLTVGAMLTRNDFNGRFSIANIDPGGVVNTINTITGGGVLAMNNNLEIMASYKQGRNKFGFGFAYAGTSNETNPAGGNSSERSASQIGFNLGYLGNVGPGFLLDVGASIQLPSASNNPAGGNETSVSQTNIGINARAFYTLSSKFKVVPTFTFATSSGSADVPNAGGGTTSNDLPSTSIIIFGVGISYQSGDFLFAGGPSFATIGITQPSVENVSPETTTSTTLFPSWNLGAEWGMLDWLYARFGYISITGSVSTETAASATTVNETVSTLYGPTGAYVGLGLKLGNLSLDGTVNSDVLRQGLNNLAGGGATFAYLSMSLFFD